jgi:NADPH-dependent curcumin reductase CurA
VIGIAGGTDKQDFLMNGIMLDGSIDYKHPEKSVSEQLEEVCPEGVDFIYDNVGGQILDDLLLKINPNGRVVVCGAVSQYSGKLHKGLVHGPSNYLKLAERGATMKGFNVMQYLSKILFAMAGMFWMHLRGKVFMKEHIEHGIGSFPTALNKLFTGGHIGKCLVDVKK